MEDAPRTVHLAVVSEATVAQVIEDEYERVNVNACKELDVDVGLVVIVKRGKRYYRLKPESVDHLFEEIADQRRSLCRTLITDIFGLTSYQYAKVKKEFEAPAPSPLGSSGVFQKNDGPNDYLIFIKEPEDAPWYDDRRLQMVGTAAGLASGIVGAVAGYKYGKRARTYSESPVVSPVPTHKTNYY
jgi:hypothetical protein